MASSYPGFIKEFVRLVNGLDKYKAEHINDAYEEIEAIQAVLGTNPQGLSPTVRERIEALAALLAALDSNADGKADAAESVPWSGVIGKPYDIVKVHLSAQVPLVHNTYNILNWGVFSIQRVSGANLWDSGSRVYIRKTGVYRLTIWSRFDANANGGRIITFRKNAAGNPVGGIPLVDFDAPPNPVPYWGVTIAAGVLANLSAGDYIEVVAYQSSGVTLNLLGAHFEVEER
jgi:hypothetical protein